MSRTPPPADFSPEQRELWQRVTELWALSRKKDEAAIRSALHPQYVGWDLSAPFPHDRDYAVWSVSGESPELTEYELHPLSVQVYEQRVGVVHYSYRAAVVPPGGQPRTVAGKWTEVYLKQAEGWTMIAVCGGADLHGSAAPP